MNVLSVTNRVLSRRVFHYYSNPTRKSASPSNRTPATTTRSFSSSMFLAGALSAGTAGTTLTLCHESKSKEEDNLHSNICPEDEFYNIPEDYVPKNCITANDRAQRRPSADRNYVLGPCDVSWARFDMCINKYVDEHPVVDMQLAEQRCLKYGLPFLDCFQKNHDGIMRRYSGKE